MFGIQYVSVKLLPMYRYVLKYRNHELSYYRRPVEYRDLDGGDGGG